jgi:hypothetical protein
MELTIRARRGNRGDVKILWHGKEIGSVAPGQDLVKNLPSPMALHGIKIEAQKGDGVKLSYNLEDRP